MANESNVFGFDANRMSELFKAPQMDKFIENMNIPFESMLDAQQKNVDALVEANKVAVSGYQELYQRQVAIFEEAIAQSKDRLAELQGQPVNADTVAKNVEIMKTSFEKALSNVHELAEMAQKANAGAYDVIKARVEEAMAEFKGAAEKIQG
jgi:phasin family protein